MATDSAVRSVTNTLSTTTVDTVTLTQAWPAIQVTNADASNDVYVRQDGVAPTAAGDNCTRIPAGTSAVLQASVTSVGTHVIGIIGNGGSYTIEGVN